MKRKLKRETLKCVWCRKPFEDEYGNILERAVDHYEYCGKSTVSTGSEVKDGN